LGNFRCTSAIQTHNLKVTGSNPIPATSQQDLENTLFLSPEFWSEISFAEAAKGKSQRKIDGVARDVMTQL
jgi:hypothetical protein